MSSHFSNPDNALSKGKGEFLLRFALLLTRRVDTRDAQLPRTLRLAPARQTTTLALCSTFRHRYHTHALAPSCFLSAATPTIHLLVLLLVPSSASPGSLSVRRMWQTGGRSRVRPNNSCSLLPRFVITTTRTRSRTLCCQILLSPPFPNPRPC
jgi:hypothetical protein